MKRAAQTLSRLFLLTWTVLVAATLLLGQFYYTSDYCLSKQPPEGMKEGTAQFDRRGLPPGMTCTWLASSPRGPIKETREYGFSPFVLFGPLAVGLALTLLTRYGDHSPPNPRAS